MNTEPCLAAFFARFHVLIQFANVSLPGVHFDGTGIPRLLGLGYKGGTLG